MNYLETFYVYLVHWHHFYQMDEKKTAVESELGPEIEKVAKNCGGAQEVNWFA